MAQNQFGNVIKYLRSSAHAAELCKVNSEKNYKTRCFDIKLNKVHVLNRIKMPGSYV